VFQRVNLKCHSTLLPVNKIRKASGVSTYTNQKANIRIR